MNNRTDERLQLAVLQLLKFNGDVSQIVGELYTYSDISNVVRDLKSNGMANDLSGRLQITKLGENHLQTLITKNSYKKGELHILPQYKYFSRKMDKFDIYLKDRDILR